MYLVLKRETEIKRWKDDQTIYEDAEAMKQYLEYKLGNYIFLEVFIRDSHLICHVDNNKGEHFSLLFNAYWRKSDKEIWLDDSYGYIPPNNDPYYKEVRVLLDLVMEMKNKELSNETLYLIKEWLYENGYIFNKSKGALK